MQFSVVSVSIFITLIYQVTGQGTTPNPLPGSGTPTTPPGIGQSGPNPNPGPSSNPPGSNTPSTSNPPPGPGTPSTSTPSSPPGGAGSTPPGSSGAGTDNLPCLKNLLDLCQAYQFQFSKVADAYGCTSFTNPLIFDFHNALVTSSVECDNVLALEIMRQTVTSNKGQPGPSTHNVS